MSFPFYFYSAQLLLITNALRAFNLLNQNPTHLARLDEAETKKLASPPSLARLKTPLKNKKKKGEAMWTTFINYFSEMPGWAQVTAFFSALVVGDDFLEILDLLTEVLLQSASFAVTALLFIYGFIKYVLLPFLKWFGRYIFLPVWRRVLWPLLQWIGQYVLRPVWRGVGGASLHWPKEWFLKFSEGLGKCIEKIVRMIVRIAKQLLWTLPKKLILPKN